MRFVGYIGQQAALKVVAVILFSIATFMSMQLADPERLAGIRLMADPGWVILR